MSTTAQPLQSVVERAAERSSAVVRSRARQAQQAQAIIDAGRRLMIDRGDEFTTQELVKEAGVALQTFYRLFSSKDLLLLAVLEATIADYCLQIDEAVRVMSDPLARLRTVVTSAVLAFSAGGQPAARFVTAQHWRLHQLYPEEVARATQPFSDLLARHIDEAVAQGSLAPRDVARESWFTTQLVMAVFHHFAFATAPDDPDAVAEQLWQFCFAALGGRADQIEAEGP